MSYKLHIITSSNEVGNALKRALTSCLSVNPVILLYSYEQTATIEINDMLLFFTSEKVIFWKTGQESLDCFNFPFDLKEVITKIESNLTDAAERTSLEYLFSPLICNETLTDCLEDILKNAYGKLDEEPINSRYLFVESDDSSSDKIPFYFDSLFNVLQSLNLAQKSTWEEDELTKAIKELNKESEDVSAKKLRQEIEKSCFQSGAEEIQEVLFCDKEISRILSEATNDNNDKAKLFKQCEPALRMLWGAFAAGDVRNKKIVEKKTEEILKQITNESPEEKTCSRLLDELPKWLERVHESRNGLNLKVENLAPLFDYLKGRHILLIEDELYNENWDIVLPLLFGAVSKETKIEKNKDGQDIGNVRVTHKMNAEKGLNFIEGHEDKFDIVLLDLYSTHNGNSASTFPTIRKSIKEFTQFINSLYRHSAKNNRKDFVATSIPQIVVFSREVKGISVRSMLIDLDVTDYFFKDSQEEPHELSYYSTFRNSLINALKRNIIHILNLPHSNSNNIFNDWLSHFKPYDCAPILRIMKHFRYYQALEIASIFDYYFGATIIADNKQEHVEYSVKNFDTDFTSEEVWISYLGRANKSGPASLSILSKSEWVNTYKPNFMDYHQLIEELIDKINRSSDFSPKEFKEPYNVERLCSAIKINCNLSLDAKKKPIEWLNELLKVPDFYDILHERMEGVKFSKEIGALAESTRDYRNNRFPEINNNGQKDIKKFNRLLLEQIYPNETPKNRLHIILVDDMGITGGQFESYIWKFINKRIWSKLVNYKESDFVKFFKETIEIHLIFAVGIENNQIEKILVDEEILKENRKLRSLIGEYFVRLCIDNHDSLENCIDGSDKCGDYLVSCYIHIADYTENLKEIYKNDTSFYSDVLDILKRYTLITKPLLEREFPCDFEPLGWERTGGLIATYANVPGNTIPIIWGQNGRTDWNALFYRFFSPWSPGTPNVSLKCENNGDVCKLNNNYDKNSCKKL